MGETVLSLKDISYSYDPYHKNSPKAVKNLSLDIKKGETFGLVGESGCGKTTTGKMIVRLLSPTSGKIEYEGEDISGLKSRVKQLEYRRRVQMIFQDPYASLDPRMKVKDIIAEGIRIHKLIKNEKDIEDRVGELLTTVGLQKDHASRYPHEFSGGQRQRIGIARALAVNPELIVCDEPISALDVSVQAQVVNLLKQLQKDHDLTMIFIAHDLSMVKVVSDRIGVMCSGELVELSSAQEVYEHPLHDYTRSLLSAIPLPDPVSERKRKRIPYIPETGLKDKKWIEKEPSHFILE